ncbi:MAG: tRNA preQ1(34) S-adenosylmethionine ribosyltransferase-isomerase QueA [Candidatus Hydrothermales bacterium]
MVKVPKNFIALFPSKPRDSCKLMVLKLKEKLIIHSKFNKLYEFLQSGDVVVVNNTKVIPAKLFGFKPTGGKVELLFVKKISDRKFFSLLKGKNVKKFYIGKFELEIKDKDKFYTVELKNGEIDELIKKHGKMPLPPYIKREPVKRDTYYYNTIFAKKEGSIAAPTASLHFTKRLVKKLTEKNIKVIELTLHIGPFTFLNDIEDTEITKEFYEIPPDTAKEIEEAKKRRSKVVSVGTTVTRALETWGINKTLKGYTDLLIKPNFNFKITDILLTNFHLENLSPILLTRAFVKDDHFLKKAYIEAINKKYKFFSYGDAMIIIS